MVLQRISGQYKQANSATIFCIRSEVHDTTSVQGKHQKDPLGWHVTLCYKDEEQMAKGTHIACNGYVKGKDNLEFVQVTHAEEKVDSWEKSNGKVVWPFEEDLEIAPEIGYGHFPEDHKN